LSHAWRAVARDDQKLCGASERERTSAVHSAISLLRTAQKLIVTKAARLAAGTHCLCRLDPCPAQMAGGLLPFL